MYELEYNGEKIKYELKKSKIKNMYIHIKEGQVIVKAPLRMKDEKIYAFVQEKSRWIYKKVKEAESKKKDIPEVTIEDYGKLKEIVEKSIYEYSEKLGLYPNKVRIKEIKYAWGSCSSNKNITISSKLAGKDEQAIKYVVLHEMCHLRYMNHSKQFWNLVETYMPDYKINKKKL